LKYFISVLSIIFAFSGPAYCQDDGSNRSDNSDTAYQAPDNSNENNSNTPDTGFAHPSFDYRDFRNANWGMTKDQVRAVETASPDDDKQKIADESSKEILCYTGTFAGLAVDIDYMFVGDSLSQGYYGFHAREKSGDELLANFDQIKTVVDGGYWVADIDTMIWSDETYKDDSDNWGLAISEGDFEKYAQWHTDYSTISLELYKESEAIWLDLIYQDARVANSSDSKEQDDSGGE
jgi:hypothetical protein